MNGTEVRIEVGGTKVWEMRLLDSDRLVFKVGGREIASVTPAMESPAETIHYSPVPVGTCVGCQADTYNTDPSADCCMWCTMDTEPDKKEGKDVEQEAHQDAEKSSNVPGDDSGRGIVQPDTP